MVTRPAITRSFQSRDPSIAAYATTYQYHPMLMPRIKSILAFWKKEVLHVSKSCWQSSWILEHKLARRLLADQRLSHSGVDKAKVVAYTLQNYRKSRRSGKRKESPGRSRHDSWDVNISFSRPSLPGVVMAASY